MGLVDLEIGKGIPTDKQVELHKLFEQAKQMEKEQIKEAYCEGNDFIGAEQYYKETYNK